MHLQIRINRVKIQCYIFLKFPRHMCQSFHLYSCNKYQMNKYKYIYPQYILNLGAWTSAVERLAYTHHCMWEGLENRMHLPAKKGPNLVKMKTT